MKNLKPHYYKPEVEIDTVQKYFLSARQPAGIMSVVYFGFFCIIRLLR